MAGRNYFISIIIVSILASCSATKKVPPGDALYMGATVDLEAPGSRPSLKKELRSELISLTRPKPNQRILGIPFKLLFNNNKLLRKKMGEPPVLLSSVNVDHNVKVLRSNLENRGYFHAQVQGDTTVKRKRGRAIYTVQAGERYFINKVEYIQDTSAVLQRTINESSAKTFLKAGDPFDLAVIKGERERIDAYLKERGFYYFDPDFLIIQADSTVGDHKVDLYVKIKPETPVQAREIYTINDVFIYPRYRLRPTAGDTSKANAVFYAGYYLVDSQKFCFWYEAALWIQLKKDKPGNNEVGFNAIPESIKPAKPATSLYFKSAGRINRKELTTAQCIPVAPANRN